MLKNLKIRDIIFSVFVILFIGVIFILRWINNSDFKNSIIKTELRELEVIARSTSLGIENNPNIINQEAGEISRLVEHINNEEELFSFILNDKSLVLSHPHKGFINKNIFEISNKILDTNDLSRLKSFVNEMGKSPSGTAVLYFPSEKNDNKKELMLFAFSRLTSGGNVYYIVVGEPLAVFTNDLHRHLWNIVLLIGVFFFILLTLSYIFYYIQKKRIKVEVTNRALEIINRQLHCQIDDYKYIEKKLREPAKKSNLP